MNVYLLVTFLATIKGDEICGPGGFWDECDSLCVPVATCNDPNPEEPSSLVRMCPALCLAGCSCHKGYVLHEGNCIRPENCHKKGDDICGPGGHLNECASGCDLVPTCANPNPEKPFLGTACTNACLRICSCYEGYILHKEKCVKVESCPKLGKH